MSTPSSRARRRTDGAAGAAGLRGASASGLAGGGRRGAGAAVDVDDLAARLLARLFVLSPARWRPRRREPEPRPRSRALGRRRLAEPALLRRSRRLRLRLGRIGRRRLPRSSIGRLPRARLSRERPPPAFAGSAFCAGASAAAPSPSVSTTCPTLTLSPGLTLTSWIVPLTLDGTSIVALSVSSSRTGWSFSMRVPGLDEHADDIACGDVLSELRES